MNCDISFVIPCYRSENTITAVVSEIKEEMHKSLPERSYEIFLVNDCSPDNVWAVIKELCAADDNIHGISFSKNFGQHSALMAGYRYCRGDIIISLDDDGQAPVESIGALVDKIEEGYDVVFGRYQEVKQSLFRRIGSKINTKMCEVLLGKPKEIVSNSFYAMRHYIAAEMIRYENCYPYLGGLIFRSTKNLANIDVKQRDRSSGSSGYTLGKLIGLWINGFTAFSIKPLRASSLMGAICAAIGFCMGIYTVIHKLLVPTVVLGYSSIVSIILFIGGMIMLMLGMIGEYIGRIYISINNSPQYVIKEYCRMDDVLNNNKSE